MEDKDVKIEKLNDLKWKIEKTGNMNVPGIVYASEKLLKDMEKDRTLQQVKNVAALPGILKHSIALADAHEGYGFSIGGVAAFDLKNGVISPGGVGYDINCSVRLLKTNLMKEDVEKNKKKILDELYEKVPSGVGRGGKFNVDKRKFAEILISGAQWMVEHGYGEKEDYLHTEEEGKMKGADVSKISERAIKRGIGQLGTIGAGNHFLEVQYVDEIFDSYAAKVLGLKKNQVCVMIHCGSRGLGHQVASDYIQLMEKEYGSRDLKDRELVNAPIQSKLGQDYYKAMCCAVNYAFANKQLITHNIRLALKNLFPEIKVDVVYDISHNIAKFEEHIVDGKKTKICVHRKGATRAFGIGRIEIPEFYRKIGQPVLIPGSMGTSSYVLLGSKKAEELTFGSTVHGAGRVESRSSAVKRLNAEKVRKELEKKGVLIKSGSTKGIIEEAPEVYKDIEEVVNVVDKLGLSKKVARLKPLGVIKG